MCKVTVVKFEQAKEIVELLGGVYKTTFEKIYGPAIAMRD